MGGLFARGLSSMHWLTQCSFRSHRLHVILGLVWGIRGWCVVLSGLTHNCGGGDIEMVMYLLCHSWRSLVLFSTTLIMSIVGRIRAT